MTARVNDRADRLFDNLRQLSGSGPGSDKRREGKESLGERGRRGSYLTRLEEGAREGKDKLC